MKTFAIIGKLNMRHCAFCKYWNDPANTAITPKKGHTGVWEYDTDERRPCLKWANSERRAYFTCRYFDCKM